MTSADIEDMVFAAMIGRVCRLVSVIIICSYKLYVFNKYWGGGGQYSPDLSPPDFFLFPKIKAMLNGRRFEDTENIGRYVTKKKKRFTSHANGFKKCFQQFYERAQKCVTSQGDYLF
jgi:hypothetical protein